MHPRKHVTANHILPTTLFLIMLTPLFGCRLCSDCEDMDYPAYGGSWQRTVRDSGRVGSIFDSAGGKVSELTSRDEPLPTGRLGASTAGPSHPGNV